MFVQKIFIFGLLLFSFLGEQEESDILYKERSALTWEDFKGQPIDSTSKKAFAKTGIGYDWTYSTANLTLSLECKVDAFFLPEQSWVRNEARTESQLDYEQGFFEIAELHARVLKLRFNDYKIRRNIRRDLNTIYNQTNGELKTMQLAYEKAVGDYLDTNKDLKASWKTKITDSLRYYNELFGKKNSLKQ